MSDATDRRILAGTARHCGSRRASLLATIAQQRRRSEGSQDVRRLSLRVGMGVPTRSSRPETAGARLAGLRSSREKGCPTRSGRAVSVWRAAAIRGAGRAAAPHAGRSCSSLFAVRRRPELQRREIGLQLLVALLVGARPLRPRAGGPAGVRLLIAALSAPRRRTRAAATRRYSPCGDGPSCSAARSAFSSS